MDFGVMLLHSANKNNDPGFLHPAGVSVLFHWLRRM